MENLWSKGISTSGIDLSKERQMSGALSNRLVLVIALPTPFRSIKAISKVAWIRKVPIGDQYEIGNQFLNLSEEDKKHLKNCLERTASAT